MPEIKEQLKNLPKSSGVYHFIDIDGVVLYVGKAKNLKNRVKQYFLKELNRGPAIPQMIEKAASIKWIETESEIEAVILEADLIKKLKPKYNIRLKDDKSFLVIKISKKESPTPPNLPSGRGGDSLFPLVELVRFNNVDFKDKSAEYFGPYPAGDLLKKSLRYLRRIFPFRDCTKTKFNSYQKKNRPCLYGDIGVCLAPCAQEVSVADYLKNINYLKSFLKGRKKELIDNLEREMKGLARAKKFEEAAIVRNKLLGLEHLKKVALGLRDEVFNSDNILFKRIECYDISNISGQFVVGSMVVFNNGKPDKDEYRRFRIRNNELRIKDSNNPIIHNSEFITQPKGDIYWLKQVLERRFKNSWPKPDLLVIDGGEVQLKMAKEIVKNLNLEIPVISIAKGPERKKNEFHFGDSYTAKYFAKNLEIQNIAISARDEAHRFAISYYRKLHGKELFS
jgi:excinuclease ABC subunit C